VPRLPFAEDTFDEENMFIRFMSAKIDARSQVAAGLFCAASELKRTGDVSQCEFDAIAELWEWFNIHLESPFDHLPRTGRYQRAVCWFKPTAREHLAKAWQLITILERNDFLIWKVQSRRTGYVRYEDDAQVLAEPYHDVRLLF
jgi:hypothetical protein